MLLFCEQEQRVFGLLYSHYKGKMKMGHIDRFHYVSLCNCSICYEIKLLHG